MMPMSPSVVRAITDTASPMEDPSVGTHHVDEQDVALGHRQPSFCMRSQFSITMSMPPTLKNACSAMWSASPSQIILNDSMVSASGTLEPSTLVNLVAM